MKRDDHCLDELRYYLMSFPTPPKVLPEKKSEQAVFKEKLIRKKSLRMRR